MPSKKLIICAIFIAGAAVFYDTDEVCYSIAANMAGAEVRVINSFSELVL